MAADIKEILEGIDAHANRVRKELKTDSKKLQSRRSFIVPKKEEAKEQEPKSPITILVEQIKLLEQNLVKADRTAEHALSRANSLESALLDLSKSFNEMAERQKLLEQALMDPKSDAAKKLSEEYTKKGQNTALPIFVKKK